MASTLPNGLRRKPIAFVSRSLASFPRTRERLGLRRERACWRSTALSTRARNSPTRCSRRVLSSLRRTPSSVGTKCGGEWVGKAVMSITDNPEAQEKMKEKLEELKDSELSKKGKDAFETIKEDEQTKKVCVWEENDM